jgi:hypothetical protein
MYECINNSVPDYVGNLLDMNTNSTDHLTWRGGYGFLFRSEFFFRTTQELEFFFPEFNIRLYDKNSESDYIS